MNKLVEIYDNLLHPDIIDQIESFSLSNNFPWYYTANISLPDSSKSLPGLSHFFINSSHPPHSTYEYSFFYLNILYTLAHKRNINIEEIYNGRLFMHLPNPNPGPNMIHTDMTNEEGTIPHLVCLYYVTDSDGDTILYKDDKKTELQRVSPKKGRVVFFDGSIPHCSSSPSKNTRVIVNFDFNGTFFGEEKKN